MLDSPVNNTSDPFEFRNQNYEGIRNEFISIFSSFRTLVIAQLTALAFVGKEIFATSDFEKSLGLNFVFTLIVLLPTYIGHNWLAQAVYQVSYIFVAYELPALSKLVQQNDIDDIEGRNPLWVLSNRAKSTAPRPHLASQSNVYLGGSDARMFHALQIVFSLLIFVFSTFLSASSWGDLEKQDHEVILNRSVLWVINEVIMVTCIIVSIYFWYISRTLVIDATNHWMNYLDNRNKYDRKYLRHFNENFIKKIGLNDYVWATRED